MNQPAHVADYVVEQPLGGGRFLLARAPSRLNLSATHVALKVVERNFTDEDFARVVDALTALASVRSPHLATLYEVGRQDGSIFYSMELAAGGSVAHPVTTLGPADIIRAVAGAARGAHAMHEAGLAHREIKPSNVLLTESGAKLSDLGLAQLMSPGMTVSGLGTPAFIEYLDPAVIRGEPASRASDIWALGVTLHRAMTGSSIYGQLPRDVPNTLLHVMRTPPMIDPSMAPAVGELVRRCLSPDPSARHATAEALAGDLDGVAPAL